MKKFILGLAAGACVFGTVGVASAQYGPPGYYYDDRPPPRRVYRERYYDDEPRYYDRRRYREQRNPQQRCPRDWTVQDGVCKPYTGR